MLDMLCDAVEADDYIASKQKELKVMNSIMDLRKRKLDEKTETRKIQKIEKEVENCVEDYSGIIL